MNIKKRNTIIFFLVLLVFTKIDFRFKEINPGLIHDDAAYYYHAQTVGVDLDFDYSNQLKGTDKRNLNVENNKPVPVHPIGVGILAGPFLFISNIFSNIFDLDSVISFNYFIYSLVSIFYLFLSINLLNKIIRKKIKLYKKHELYLFIFGSGISYYAFERFSMSHVYEFFSISLIFYIVFAYEKSSKSTYIKLFEFSIPILLFLLLTIRWSNYHLFIIPFIYSLIFNKKLMSIYIKPMFIFGFFIGIIGFLLHTKYLYGLYTFNPSDIFLMVENRLSENYDNLKNPKLFFNNINLIFYTFFITSFSQEFGIFYFSAIVFIGFIFLIFFLIQKKYLLFLTLGLTYLIPFIGIVVFQNTSYSYGYRYLFSLIPINILLYFKYFQKNKIISTYLNLFSIFGLIGLMMFEVSEATVLSIEYVTNSFGASTKFANPNYLSGVFYSIIQIDSYLNIVFTSFLGILIIKLLSILTNPANLILNFRPLTDDISQMINNAQGISWIMIIILLIFLALIARKSFSEANT